MFGPDPATWFEEARRDANPYLTEWFAAMMIDRRTSALFSAGRVAWTKALADGQTSHQLRRALAHKYAWAVPCEAALELIASLAPVVEIGAGSGYWAWLLRKRGVDILAYDSMPLPCEDNVWHAGAEPWTRVETGGPQAAASHPGRSLFLCWPPYDLPMASACLKAYRGQTLIYVGESRGGCNADDAFFETLEREWEQTGEVILPQWDSIHDWLGVWKRKESPATQED